MSPTENDFILTIRNPALSELKEKKSIFISCAMPVTNEEEIKSFLQNIKIKYPGANHYPYAYRTGTGRDNFRYYDDGEPSGSSGKPILDAIDKYKLSNVLVVVARYFGGIKLGVGGLRRAYFGSSDTCLKSADIVKKYFCEHIEIVFDYKYISSVMNLIDKEKINILKKDLQENVKMEIYVKLSASKKFCENLVNLTNGNCKISVLNSFVVDK